MSGINVSGSGLIIKGWGKIRDLTSAPLDRIFSQQSILLASDAAVEDTLGWSVDITANGNIAVVGARWKNINGNHSGAAYVYKRTTSYWGPATWTEIQRLEPSDGDADHQFGYAVAISGNGDTILVSANADGLGSVYIFSRDGTTWVEQQKLETSDTAGNGGFGESIAISEDGGTIAVGALYEAGLGVDWTGAAYIFVPSETQWVEYATLVADDAEAHDRFGTSIALSSNGDTIVVGAPREDTGGDSAGAVYVFESYDQSGVEEWGQTAKLQSQSASPNALFGSTVSISGNGNIIVVGAPTDSVVSANAGSASLFTRSDLSYVEEWTETIIVSDSISAGDNFGTSVAVSSDGENVIVGAPVDATTGAAYVFRIVDTSGVEEWTQTQQLVSDDAAPADQLGYSVAVSNNGRTVIAGSPGKDTGGAGAGAAYVFKG